MNNKEIFLKFILPLLLTVAGMMAVAFFVIGGFFQFLGEDKPDTQSNNIDRLEFEKRSERSQ